MDGPCVVAFTDLYHPTVNGITDTIDLWKRRWSGGRGRMAVVHPAARGYDPGEDEFAIPSVAAPLYSEYRMGIPILPSGVPPPDIVHVHTPFTVGIRGVEAARSRDVPLIGSYHTLVSQRIRYFVTVEELAAGLQRVVRMYERWFYDTVDLVVTPSAVTRAYLEDNVGLDGDIEVVSNGIDTARFHPVDAEEFLNRHELRQTDRIVGYTGRHSPEKHLHDLITAVDGTDLTLLLGGDGPSQSLLKAHASRTGADVRFLGFLDRRELPAFYSALDVFAFPSPTETQGLVALQANACGTPVVGADAGALPETVHHGRTGYLYPLGNIDALQDRLFQAIHNADRLRETCLDRRPAMDVDRSLDRLESIYDSLR